MAVSGMSSGSGSSGAAFPSLHPAATTTTSPICKEHKLDTGELIKPYSIIILIYCNVLEPARPWPNALFRTISNISPHRYTLHKCFHPQQKIPIRNDGIARQVWPDNH